MKKMFIALALAFAAVSAGQASSFASCQNEKVLTVVEVMPSFPGGEAALMKFITENRAYPKSEAERGIQGRVIVGFVVAKDGKIRDVHIMRGASPLLDEAAMDVVKKMPRWNPGKERGKKVNVKYQVPVTFRLQ